MQHVNGPGSTFAEGNVLFFSFGRFDFVFFLFLNIFYLLADFSLFILLPLITALRGVTINLVLVMIHLCQAIG